MYSLKLSLGKFAKWRVSLQNFQKAMDYAAQADEFCSEKWGNHLADGLFWQSISAYRLGDADKASRLADELGERNPNYGQLARLRVTISE